MGGSGGRCGGAEAGPRQPTRHLSPRNNTPGSAGASLGPALKARAGGGPEARSVQSRAGDARILANESVSGGRALLRVFPTPAGPGGLRRPHHPERQGRRAPVSLRQVATRRAGELGIRRAQSGGTGRCGKSSPLPLSHLLHRRLPADWTAGKRPPRRLHHTPKSRQPERVAGRLRLCPKTWLCDLGKVFLYLPAPQFSLLYQRALN